MGSLGVAGFLGVGFLGWFWRLVYVIVACVFHWFLWGLGFGRVSLWVSFGFGIGGEKRVLGWRLLGIVSQISIYLSCP